MKEFRSVISVYASGMESSEEKRFWDKLKVSRGPCESIGRVLVIYITGGMNGRVGNREVEGFFR